MSEPGEAPSTLHPVTRIVWHHGRAMAVFFFAVLIITAVATILMPRAYRSQARLLLRLGRENTTLDPTVTLGQQPVFSVPFTRELEINTSLDILTSRGLAEQVIEAMGPAVVLGNAPPGTLAPVA